MIPGQAMLAGSADASASNSGMYSVE